MAAQAEVVFSRASVTRAPPQPEEISTYNVILCTACWGAYIQTRNPWATAIESLAARL